MTTCILHGGFTREKNTQNEEFYKEIATHTKEGGTILYVYFASKEEEDSDVRFREHQGRILAHGRGKNFKHMLATHKGFLEELAGADTVFINGGVPKKLMDALHSYPGIQTSLTGKVLAGSSSGAYALSSYYYSVSPMPGVYQGLGIAPVRLTCHYETEHSREHYRGKEALELLDRYPHELELVVLRDYEWRTITI